eukprot:4395714-Amphidinium_carterae.1
MKPQARSIVGESERARDCRIGETPIDAVGGVQRCHDETPPSTHSSRPRKLAVLQHRSSPNCENRFAEVFSSLIHMGGRCGMFFEWWFTHPIFAC